jgi:CheY-like chemotaxis protein
MSILVLRDLQLLESIGKYNWCTVSVTITTADPAKAGFLEPRAPAPEARFGIIRQSGGSVWVYSEPGHGSTFKIHLPRSDEVERQAPGPAQMPSPRGSETLLLVEDDDQLRAVASGILRHGGYRVLDARNGTEALLVCEQIDGPIHLLVTDVVMPSMGGRELAEHALRLRPGLRVLFMSGYTEDAIADRHTLGPDVFLLQKPITPDTLLHKVREVLDRTSGP